MNKTNTLHTHYHPPHPFIPILHAPVAIFPWSFTPHAPMHIIIFYYPLTYFLHCLSHHPKFTAHHWPCSSLRHHTPFSLLSTAETDPCGHLRFLPNAFEMLKWTLPFSGAVIDYSLISVELAVCKNWATGFKLVRLGQPHFEEKNCWSSVIWPAGWKP